MGSILKLFLSGLISLAIFTSINLPQSVALGQASAIAQVAPRSSSSGNSQETFDGRQLYRKAFEALRDYHVTLTDTARRNEWKKIWENKFDNSGELDTPPGTDRAIGEMVHSLGQRFDYYLDESRTASMKEEESGQFVGIGVSIRPVTRGSMTISKENPILFAEVFEEGPAYESGLRNGDTLRAIDGKSPNGLSLAELVKLLRGKPGSTVKLAIERAGPTDPSILEFSVTRRVVETTVVLFKDMGDGVSYIRLSNFTAITVPEKMREALTRAAAGRSLILDLRNNPGGRIDYAYSIASMLMHEGEIVEVLQRDGDSQALTSISLLRRMIVEEQHLPDGTTRNYRVYGRGQQALIPRDMPVVVLVNTLSASASELLSGALQSSRRATVVGEPTVGKGVGQVVVPLPFKRTINVTTLEFRPNGRKIDWTGIIPDVPESSTDNGKDVQLEKALSTAKGLATKQETQTKKATQIEQEHRRSFEMKGTDK